MNFIFISPNFPSSYYRFCMALRRNGVTVLGIGDTPYDSLSEDVKRSLNEYYYVHSLSDYQSKKDAVAYFQYKYGRIDFIESNNEFWMQDDAQLRTDFNVTSGPNVDQVYYYRHKSAMKEIYKTVPIKSARYCLPRDIEEAKAFIAKVKYPVIVKPDDGVGASKTHALHNDEELQAFFNTRDGNISYIMEEFVEGDLISFDGVCNSNGDVIYAVSHAFPTQIMDVVNDGGDVFYYTLPDVPEDLDAIGRKVVKAFNAKSRFFHLEFFRLTKGKRGLGKKGDIVGLEVNMRVPGGFTPDLINFAHSIDIYQIWADVIAFDENRQNLIYPRTYACYVGRRNYVNYAHYYEEIMEKYHNEIMLTQGMPDVLSGAMGNYFFMAKFDSLTQMQGFIRYLIAHKEK